jgi:hypothetical protein
LKGFDAVLDPGFLEANPTLKESLEYPDSFTSMINECYSILDETVEEPDKIINEKKEVKNIEEKLDMDLLETVKTMTVENTKIKSALDDTLKSEEKIKADYDVLQSENESLRKQLKEQEDDMEKEKKKKEDDEEEEKEEAKKVAEAEKAFAEEFGTKEDIKLAFETLESKLDAYAELGTVEEIKSAFEAVAKFEEDFGTKEEIERLLAAYEILGEKQISANAGTRAEKLAQELDAPVEKVEALVAKEFTDEAIKEFFKDMKEAFKVKNTYGSKKKVDESKKTKKTPFNQPLGESILGKMKFNLEENEPTNQDKSTGESLLEKLV